MKVIHISFPVKWYLVTKTFGPFQESLCTVKLDGKK